MKGIIIFIITIGIGLSGFSQTTNNNVATMKKNNSVNALKDKPVVKEVHTHTFTTIPKDKAKKLKIEHPIANKHMVKRLTPQEAAEFRKLKEKQKNKQ